MALSGCRYLEDLVSKTLGASLIVMAAFWLLASGALATTESTVCG